MTINSIQGPLTENLYLNSANRESGNKLNKIFDPSSGGMGIKLKTNNEILIKVIMNKKLESKLLIPKIGDKNLNNKAKIKTQTKLAKGPAKETRAMPERG